MMSEGRDTEDRCIDADISAWITGINYILHTHVQIENIF